MTLPHAPFLLPMPPAASPGLPAGSPISSPSCSPISSPSPSPGDCPPACQPTTASPAQSTASPSAAAAPLWPELQQPWWQPYAPWLHALAPSAHPDRPEHSADEQAVFAARSTKTGGDCHIPSLHHLLPVAQRLNEARGLRAAPALANWQTDGQTNARQAGLTAALTHTTDEPDALSNALIGAHAQPSTPASAAPPTPAEPAWPHALPRFVPQATLPADQAYEAFIRATGQVPTRDNWHDLLNGLVWLRMPRTKQQLNALQAAELARDGVQGKRGPVRDACTVFDENAALLHAPDALWQALAERRWADLFGPLRPLWREASLLVFGHAALEKLLLPYPSITVHVWRVALPVEVGNLLALDAWLAQDLQADKLATKPFAPLPVLGVPGWWPGNEAPGFYEDASVFRPRRAAR